eukprot:scaffold20212_cov25-Tisochrysis_lutea.AAC.1
MCTVDAGAGTVAACCAGEIWCTRVPEVDALGCACARECAWWMWLLLAWHESVYLRYARWVRQCIRVCMVGVAAVGVA